MIGANVVGDWPRMAASPESYRLRSAKQLLTDAIVIRCVPVTDRAA